MSVKVVTPRWAVREPTLAMWAIQRNAIEARMAIFNPKLTPGERHRAAGASHQRFEAALDGLRDVWAKLSLVAAQAVQQMQPFLERIAGWQR